MREKLNTALSTLGQALKKVFGRTAVNAGALAGHAPRIEQIQKSKSVRPSISHRSGTRIA